MNEKVWPLQLRYTDEPWRVIAVCVLLNRARGTAVESVAEHLFERFPTVESLISANEHALMAIVESLGLKEKRAAALKAIGVWYSPVFQRKDYEMGNRSVDEIPGVGRYGRDSYEIFVLGDLSVEPTDRALIRYLEENRDD